MSELEPAVPMRSMSASRRQFLLGGLAGGLGAIGATLGTVWHAAAISPYSPQLERLALTVPARHAGLAGLKIAFVADTHVGPHIRAADVERALDLLRPSRPDLVLLGGDYISESPRFAAEAAAVLGPFVGEAPLGGYAVLGNHDAGERGRDAKVVAALSAVGIPTLRNEAVPVESGRGVLWIAGVDDALMGRADPAATLDRVPRGAAALALWHEPDDARLTAAHGAFGQLSGHSHGGQIRIPGIGPLVLPRGGRRYVSGLNQAAGMPVYTTRGVGVYLPPMRLNCPPEVTLVTLTAPVD